MRIEWKNQQHDTFQSVTPRNSHKNTLHLDLQWVEEISVLNPRGPLQVWPSMFVAGHFRRLSADPLRLEIEQRRRNVDDGGGLHGLGRADLAGERHVLCLGGQSAICFWTPPWHVSQLLELVGATEEAEKRPELGWRCVAAGYSAGATLFTGASRWWFRCFISIRCQVVMGQDPAMWGPQTL